MVQPCGATVVLKEMQKSIFLSHLSLKTIESMAPLPAGEFPTGVPVENSAVLGDEEWLLKCRFAACSQRRKLIDRGRELVADESRMRSKVVDAPSDRTARARE